MSLRDLLQYYEKKTWFHKVDPIVKMFYSFIFISLSFVYWSFKILLFLTILSIFILVTIKPPRDRFLVYLKIIAFITISTTLSQGFFYYKYYTDGSGTIIFYIIPPTLPILNLITLGKGIALIYEGLTYGLIVSLKITIMTLASLPLIFTTKPGDLLKSLQKAGVPSRIALAAITTLRFIPILIEELYNTALVLRLKGEKISVTRFLKIIKILFKNAILNSARRAYVLGLSLELRGIKDLNTEEENPEDSMYKNLMVIIFALITIVATIIIKSLNFI